MAGQKGEDVESEKHCQLVVCLSHCAELATCGVWPVYARGGCGQYNTYFVDYFFSLTIE